MSSAVFDLRESGSEGEFEANRQRAILLTVAYYAAENERINGLKGSETELAALRDANDLARRIALGRLTGLENTFTTQRIKNEMSVAEAATEAAEAAIAATEKRAAAAMKAAEAEAEAQRRAAEAAEVAAARQRGRESDAAAGLLQTGVGQARFDLGLSGSEGEFEINRQGLIVAANAYYDNELARINELGLSEIELDDRRKANELNRQMALSRAITITNSFTTERVRAEERALDEIERMRDDAIDAEERRLDTIQDLKDDAFDAEQDRADALVDLEQDTQDRITDIIRNANRSKEDIERDFQDDIQDIQRQEVEGTLTAAETTSQLFDLGRERNRDSRDLDIRSGRRQQDVGIRQGRGAEDINVRADTELAALQMETAALSAETVQVESVTAAMVAETAQVESLTAEMNAVTAETFSEAVVAFEGLEPVIERVIEGLEVVSVSLGAGIEGRLGLTAPVNSENMLPLQAPAIPPLNVGSVSITANSVSVNGSVTGEGGAGGTGDGDVVIDARINNILTLPDGATAELGSNQHRLRAQRRSS